MLVRIQMAVLATALIFLFFIMPHTLLGDGAGRFGAMTTLMTTGEWPEMRYSYVGPLFSAPAWLFDGRAWWTFWAERYNTLLLISGVAALWWLLRPVMDGVSRGAFLLLLAAAGMMPHHLVDYYGEVFTAIAVGVGFALVFARDAWWGWILVVFGVVNMPASAVGLGGVALWRAWRQRRYDGLIAAAAAAVCILGENAFVRGGFLETGYARDKGARTVLPFSGRPGFSYPIALGVLSLTFSFGKGVLFFAPGLALIPVARRHVTDRVRAWLDASTIFTAGLLLVYAKWWAWYGGWYWGPRFLLFAVIPSSLALATMLRATTTGGQHAVALVLACWTVWVGVSGVVWGQLGLEVCMANNYALEHLCWYVPEFSPLFRPFYLHDGILQGWQKGWIAIATLVALLLTLSAAHNSPEERSLS